MKKTEVLYNGDCTVCRREIHHYARLSETDVTPLRLNDLNDLDALQSWGVTQDQAARRLHVRQGDVIYGGIPAFIVLWQTLPRYRWLARVVRVPGVYQLANWGYDTVIAPFFYKRHLKRHLKRRAR
ncbi:DUF393 domain-containing protein [Roseobacter sp.]|uniref:thiol-disulfide oxidoreductase DCC family protein n=1 Tax=Roseobacter sp. TaxID=1907202 RepID=UPI003298CDE9